MSIEELKQKYSYPDYIVKVRESKRSLFYSCERQSDGMPVIRIMKVENRDSAGNRIPDLTDKDIEDSRSAFISSVLKLFPL